MRSSLVMLRSTRPPRHSRVCSSTMDTILTGRPSVVASNWRSTAHTAFGASATGTVRSRRRGACAGGVEAPAGTHRAKAAESSSGGRLSLLSSRPAPRAAAAGGRPRAGSHTTVTGAPASPARQVSQSRHERALIPWCWLLQAGRARRRRKPPVIWIIILLLILGAFAAVGLRIEALTWRDKPAEPSLAQRWKAMGGG
jgi:hypothetical protein